MKLGEATLAGKAVAVSPQGPPPTTQPCVRRKWQLVSKYRELHAEEVGAPSHAGGWDLRPACLPLLSVSLGTQQETQKPRTTSGQTR